MPVLSSKNLSYTMPAEWEKHQATWLAWPLASQPWAKHQFQALELIWARLIRFLVSHEHVHLLVHNSVQEFLVIQFLKQQNVEIKNITFHRIPTFEPWIRDYGPTFLKSKNKQLTLCDWKFNAWGEKYKHLLGNDAIPEKLAGVLKLSRVREELVFEGGAIDVNGKGSALVTEQCLLNPNRNPKLSKTQIEEKLKERLGLTQMLWLKGGLAGDDTDGHVDDVARFVNENTIVCTVESRAKNENHEILAENLRRLKNMKDLDGKPFQIIEIPVPDAAFSQSEALPASYVNFYIANDIVVVPLFKEDKDPIAIEILKKLFPNRQVAGIDCRALICGKGALHCVTQQQPI